MKKKKNEIRNDYVYDYDLEPTLYGREIVTNNEDELLGINLGFSPYFEPGFTNYWLNSRLNPWTLQLKEEFINEKRKSNGFIKSLSAGKEYKRLVDFDEKAINGYLNPSYSGAIFRPSMPFCKKRVNINNSCLYLNDENLVLQMDDDTYYLLAFGTEPFVEHTIRQIEMNMCEDTICEADIFSMSEYQYSDIAYSLINRNTIVAGAKDGRGLVILAKDERVINEIIDALHRGALAYTMEKMDIFHMIGKYLIIVDRL